MKTFYTMVAALLISTAAFAQIPNASFENWPGPNPAGWYTYNSPSNGDSTVMKTATAHAGSFGLKIQPDPQSLFTTFGTYDTIHSTQMFHVSSAPLALHGWYIGHPQGNGDEIQISVAVTPATPTGTAIGGQIQAYLTDAPTVFKEFVFNVVYPTAVAADSAHIDMSLLNNSGQANPNSYFIIDDLSFGAPGGNTGIDNVNDLAVLEACTPNPASGIANIIYTVKENSTVSVTLYDMVGHQVNTLLENTQQTPGRYKIPTDVSSLPNGVYFYTLSVNGQTHTQKLVVSK